MREIIDTSQQEQILVTISAVTSDQPTSLDEASSKISGCLCKEACPLRLPRQFAGIVTDVGSPLSHSSIVAREYRIPAVLGTGVATERLHTGQHVIVDGDAGTVTPSR